MSKQILTYVTGNQRKLKQFKDFSQGKDFPFEVVSQKLDLPEYQGTSQDICLEKCRKAAEIVQGPVIVQDVSLCFNAMGGLPGPYLKWFATELKADGLYKLLTAWEDKSLT